MRMDTYDENGSKTTAWESIQPDTPGENGSKFKGWESVDSLTNDDEPMPWGEHAIRASVGSPEYETEFPLQ